MDQLLEHTADATGHEPDLETEARLFARYLVDQEPSRELVERYERAHRALFEDSVASDDEAVVRFACRRPWCLPYLDAASGLLRPDGLLRRKLLVLAAILETCPELAPEFLPRAARPAQLLLSLFWSGMVAVARTPLGVLLYALASRWRE